MDGCRSGTIELRGTEKEEHFPVGRFSSLTDCLITISSTNTEATGITVTQIENELSSSTTGQCTENYFQLANTEQDIPNAEKYCKENQMSTPMQLSQGSKLKIRTPDTNRDPKLKLKFMVIG
ncbi:unnamed protein product [Echinostoma caproni]|uniref:CUB domain-containing protein n=1 Tax=Echinostoma caproni TaxID=27848 RepID=A0A182ZZ87_9TREM|nr:unnamed protein product [Echinostoma caproni]